MNISALVEYNRQWNLHAQLRAYLIDFITDLPVIPTSSIIQIQAKALSRLTEAPNQLTRITLVTSLLSPHRSPIHTIFFLDQSIGSMSSTGCRFAFDGQSIAHRGGSDAHGTTSAMCHACFHCEIFFPTFSIHDPSIQAVNAPLQERTSLLTDDFSRDSQLPLDYETDLELEWSNPSKRSLSSLARRERSTFQLDLFADGDDFSGATIDRNRNLFYQRRLANEVMTQMDDTISLLTSGLNRHLNLGQHFLVNTPSVFMSFERLSSESLLNKKQIRSLHDVRLLLPSTFNVSFDPLTIPLLRVRFSFLSTSRSSLLSLSSHPSNL